MENHGIFICLVQLSTPQTCCKQFISFLSMDNATNYSGQNSHICTFLMYLPAPLRIDRVFLFSKLEMLSVLIAAIIHDLGVGNRFVEVFNLSFFIVSVCILHSTMVSTITFIRTRLQVLFVSLNPNELVWFVF